MKKFLLIVLTSLLLSGCSAGVSEETPLPSVILSPSPSPTPTPPPTTPMPEPTEDLTGKALNPLTGLYIDEEAAGRRPIAVVFNNLKKALPQSGIGQASLYYEVLSEADITRIIALFQDFDSERIGTIRSTREYFTYFALEHDAVFLHFGGSDAGLQAIRTYGVDNLDGRALDGWAIWRDKERISRGGMYEHSAYTSAANLLEACQNYGYDMQRTEPEEMFGFYEEFTVPNTEQGAAQITIPFAATHRSHFSYDAKEKLYSKSQNGEPHIDEETGEALTVTNVIVQEAPHYFIPGDTAGRRDVRLIGKGTGYLFTGGKYIKINWSKDSAKAPTLWTMEDGSPLILNRGKTWISIIEAGAELVSE